MVCSHCTTTIFEVYTTFDDDTKKLLYVGARYNRNFNVTVNDFYRRKYSLCSQMFVVIELIVRKTWCE